MHRLPLCILLAAASLGGCVRHTEPVAGAPELSPEQKRFQAIWRAAHRTLRDYRFQIARVDARAGILVTEPMVTKSPIEFWRSDLQRPEDLAISAIHKAYCMAIVRIEEPGPDGPFRSHTRVLFARSNEPPAQLTSAAAIAMIYTGRASLLDYGEQEVERQLEEARRRSEQGPPAAGPAHQPVGSPIEPPGPGPVHPEMPEMSSLGRLVDFEARIDQQIQARAETIYRQMHSGAQGPSAPAE
jgi:hypothetical protein